MLNTGLHHPPALCNLHISLCPDHRLSRLRLFVLYRCPLTLSTINLNIYFCEMLVCQTYVTPYLMKSWSVSFGDFHPSGRIGKQL